MVGVTEAVPGVPVVPADWPARVADVDNGDRHERYLTGGGYAVTTCTVVDTFGETAAYSASDPIQSVSEVGVPLSEPATSSASVTAVLNWDRVPDTVLEPKATVLLVRVWVSVVPLSALMRGRR